MAKKDNQAELLMDHYSKSRQDMDQRRNRKNGWNDIINAYMGKLPKNWPYTSMITDPVIRTTILEKTSRLLNAKLQGRLVPREGGDMVKAKINNAVLDFQWDNATSGGSMIEKLHKVDQYARIFGAAFAQVYWDNEKNCNEIKVCDPRDIFIDFGADHVRSAKWVQYREFSTMDQLEDRGYDLKKVQKMIKTGEEYSSDLRSTEYVDQVRSNLGLVDRIGDDLSNPVVEIVTEWTEEQMTVFLPKYGQVVYDTKNPYKHGKIPFIQLRYYPLVDELYGESEVAPVIPLQRAINATLSGFMDQANISMRPPIKVSSAGVRIETIEYGPGARWIMQNPNMVQEHTPNTAFLQAFNVAYPALKASFNTAMGDQSQYNDLSQSVTDRPTATQVKSDVAQQNTRDQDNQTFLGELLKDMMMMWLENNKQYLFDDPKKEWYIVKIIGKDNIQAFQQMKLDGKDVPDYVIQEIRDTIAADPNSVNDSMINQVMQDTAVPTNPMITDGANTENPTVLPKLDVKDNGTEADLYVEPTDMVGVYDYIPDVKSMSAGALTQQTQARQTAYELLFANPLILQLLSSQGEEIKIKDLLVNIFTDAGERDAEGLFQPVGANQPTQPGGPGAPQPGIVPPGAMPNQGMGQLPPPVSPQLGGPGMAGPQGFSGQAPAAGIPNLGL